MPSKAASATVLVVDDDEANRLLIERIFASRGDIEVVTESNGDRGLGIIRQRLPDVVLLDLNLAGLDGESLLKLIRADLATANIPVVMISGDVSRETKLRLQDAGAQAYLEKPVSISEVRDLVDKLLQ